MSTAVVFDSAGTLLETYRVAKEVPTGRLLPGVETTMLTFAVPDRVLCVIQVHTREIIDEDPRTFFSTYLREHQTGFGVSCTRKVMAAEEVGDILYTDQTATVGDLQECIRQVWSRIHKEEVVTLNNGVIINMATRAIEFMVTAGGKPFPGAKEVITTLHKRGIPAFIASGDRVTKLTKMADYLGIPRDRVFGVATPRMKAQIVCDLKEEYDRVVMVGDSINDLYAFRAADISILTEEQSGEKHQDLYDSVGHVITDLREVITIVTETDKKTPINERI
jgi:soluble P-type ATPase